MYRNFWLVNSKNETWQFTDKSVKSFFQSPQGLGYQSSLEVTQYGDVLRVDKEAFSFPKVQGDLQFYDTANASRYDMYNRYVKFCMDSPLKLCYRIDLDGTQQTFYLPCYCTLVTKTESSRNGLLTCPVSFYGLGFWEDEPISTELNNPSLNHNIVNPSDFPIGFYLKIEGTNIKNPYFTLSQDNELYGEARFDGTFSSVAVDSNDGNQNVVLEYNGSVLPNPLSYQDLSISNGAIYVTFIKLARGTSKLTLGYESGSISTLNINFVPKYRSV